MTPEAQRSAIATLLGWKLSASKSPDGTPLGIKPNKMNTAGCRIPDFLRDLNAMAEAEKTLTPEQQPSYTHALCKILCASERWTWRCTAAQRAEALLKAKGLWVS